MVPPARAGKTRVARAEKTVRAALDARTGIEVCRSAARELKNERPQAGLDFSGPSMSLAGAKEASRTDCRRRQVLQTDDELRRRYPGQPSHRAADGYVTTTPAGLWDQAGRGTKGDATLQYVLL